MFMVLNLTKLRLFFTYQYFYTLLIRQILFFFNFFLNYEYNLIYFQQQKFRISRLQSNSAAHWGFFFTVLSMWSLCFVQRLFISGIISLKPTASTSSLPSFCKAYWILITFFSISALPSQCNLQSILRHNSLAVTHLLSFYVQRIYVLN